MSMSKRLIKTALVSVWDKEGLPELAAFLSDMGVQFLSTGGSAKALRNLGHDVRDVSDLTGFPEILGGRVKTLHPNVHAGLLAKGDDKDHQTTLADHAIGQIDLLVVNLYPFEAALASGASDAECIEMIDVGGPAMIRGAAKNFGTVTVLTDPSDYADFIDHVRAEGGMTTEAKRRSLAAKAFRKTAYYDACIVDWFDRNELSAPEQFLLSGRKTEVLRYGENPDQQAAFYVTGQKRPGVATATQVQGKALSYNNYTDTDAAFELVSEFDQPACVIVKHTNPCGVAIAETLAIACQKAIAADPISAFGGIVALNRALDAATAKHLAALFLEVIIAPDATDDARQVLASKTSLRLLTTGALPDAAHDPTWMVKSLAGGFLVQTRDCARATMNDMTCVTSRSPSEAEWDDLLTAWRICKHVKSNAITLVRQGINVGNGAGQMSRVDSVRNAVQKATDMAAHAGEAHSRSLGAVLASDAFFPFADGLELAIDAGVTAVIQPGGSKRDEEVIALANARNIAMIFTGKRHFRH